MHHLRTLHPADGVWAFYDGRVEGYRFADGSNWVDCHLDHVAGTAAVADCEVIATARTAELLTAKRRAIQAGALAGPPAIDPLILPTLTFEGRMRRDVGRLRLEVIHVSIHSDDAAVIWIAQQGVLLAGDTLTMAIRTSSPAGATRRT